MDLLDSKSGLFEPHPQPSYKNPILWLKVDLLADLAGATSHPLHSPGYGPVYKTSVKIALIHPGMISA